MRKMLAVVYTAFVLGANPVLADVSGLLTGDMAKLVLTDPAAPLPEVGLIDMTDAPRSMDEFKGKWVVMNFWATWCPPCREEMPSLDRLQAAIPGLAVVPVATGRNDPAGMTRFWTDAGIANLEILRDPKSGLAHSMGVMGLPVTVILDPEGREVGRLIGDAHWDGPEAQALLQALMADN